MQTATRGQSSASPESSMRRLLAKFACCGSFLSVAIASSSAIGAPLGFHVTDWSEAASLTISTPADGIPYIEQAELGAPAPDSSDYQHFGGAVATWHDGATGVTWLAAGAYGENGTGAAYVFSRTTPQAPWHQEARLVADDAKEGDEFGLTVGIDGLTVVVGAPQRGFFYTFDRDMSGAWKSQGKTSVSGISSLGQSIAFASGVLAVGAPDDDISGHVFVYSRSGAGWTLIARLYPPDTPDGAAFGASISIDQQRLLIGAPYDSTVAHDRGSAYLFAYDGAMSSWNYQHKFQAFLDGAADDEFGHSVVLQGNNALMSAYGRNSGTGAVDNFLLDGMGNWNEQPPLQVGDGVANDLFGTSLALVGSTLVVGADQRDRDAGAIYFFSGSAAGWTPSATLTSPNAEALGFSLAVADGDILAGAPDVSSEQRFSGRVDVFSQSSGTWAFAKSIVASADDEESFGYSSAVSDDTALVTAPFRKNLDGSTGAVEIYERDALGNWNWLQTLPNLGVIPGQVLAIDGDTLVIGEPDQAFGTHASQGAAYVFVRVRSTSGDTWIQQAELADLGGSSRDEMGGAVAIDGNTIVVGAPRLGTEGVVYVYTRSGTTWSLQGKFSPAEKKTNDYLGTGLALRGNLLLVGAPGANGIGAAYVFQRSGSAWTEKKMLLASDTTASDSFGAGVALTTANDALVAAPNKNSAAGRVYLFSGTNWSNQSTIDSPSPAARNFFGEAIALNGNRMVIGEEGSNSAYLFDKSGTGWALQVTIKGDDNSTFGISVALHGPTVLVGAAFDGAHSGGRAYILQDDRIFADGYQ